MSIKLNTIFTTLNLTKLIDTYQTSKNIKQTILYYNVSINKRKTKHTTYVKTVRKSLGYPVNGQRTHTNAKMSFFLRKN
jgi:ribosomal protein S13